MLGWVNLDLPYRERSRSVWLSLRGKGGAGCWEGPGATRTESILECVLIQPRDSLLLAAVLDLLTSCEALSSTLLCHLFQFPWILILPVDYHRKWLSYLPHPDTHPEKESRLSNPSAEMVEPSGMMLAVPLSRA